MMFENPMPGISQLKEPIKLEKIEPWMADFMKERHHEEEWEAFFKYCKATPFQRALSRIAGILIDILPIPGLR